MPSAACQLQDLVRRSLRAAHQTSDSDSDSDSDCGSDLLQQPESCPNSTKWEISTHSSSLASFAAFVDMAFAALSQPMCRAACCTLRCHMCSTLALTMEKRERPGKAQENSGCCEWSVNARSWGLLSFAIWLPLFCMPPFLWGSLPFFGPIFFISCHSCNLSLNYGTLEKAKSSWQSWQEISLRAITVRSGFN